MTTQPPQYTPRQQEVMHLAADRIRVEPNAYKQDEWFSASRTPFVNEDAWEESFDHPECGTVACLAGHISLAARLSYNQFWQQGEPATCAAGEAGFSIRMASQLFYSAPSWPEPYRSRYLKAGDGEADRDAMAKAAADMLDDIADGLVWWDEDADRWVTLEEYCDERDAARDADVARDAETPEPAA